MHGLDIAQLADQFGITEGQAQAQTAKWWKFAFDKAKHECDQMNKNVAIQANKDKDLKVPYGEEVARFSAREYFWLLDQYGPGFDDDLDFLLCYRKYRNQTGLAEPSREIFG
jgi:hypothetical protein